MMASSLAYRLSEEYGTPLYLYDLTDVDQRIAELRRVLPRAARLFYSMKANPLPAVAAAAQLAGCGAEISSAGELAAAVQAGFDARLLLYTGPAKGEHELRQAIGRGVGWFSAESWRDLARIAAAARAAHTTVQVLMRVNPAAAPRARLAITGVPSPFGFEEADLDGAAARISTFSGVDIGGVHVYLGTQAATVEGLAEMFRIAVEAAERLAAVVPARVIDLGGGFPWPYAVDESPPNLQALAGVLGAMTASRRHSADATVWFESGRYVAASCGTLIARLMDVKRSRGTTYYVLDAGVSHLGGMPGLGRVLRPAVSLLPIGGDASSESIVADVVGPLCTTLDCVARGARVPVLEPGALVAIPNVGAYGATASLTAFLSRPAALEVTLRSGRVVDVTRLRGGHETVPVAQRAG